MLIFNHSEFRSKDLKKKKALVRGKKEQWSLSCFTQMWFLSLSPVSYSTFLGHFHSKVSILMAVAVVAWQSTPGLPHWEECDDDLDCSSLYNPLGVNPLAS